MPRHKYSDGSENSGMADIASINSSRHVTIEASRDIDYYNQTTLFSKDDQCGYSVDINQANVILGVPYDDNKGKNSGSAYIGLYQFGYGMPTFSVCDMEHHLTNFYVASGSYDNVVAGNITIGGSSYKKAIYKNGAKITYQAKSIVMDEGFVADLGSNFVAEAIDCNQLLSTSKSKNKSKNEIPKLKKTTLKINNLNYQDVKTKETLPLLINDIDTIESFIIAFEPNPDFPFEINVFNDNNENIYNTKNDYSSKVKIDYSNFKDGYYRIIAKRNNNIYEAYFRHRKLENFPVFVEDN